MSELTPQKNEAPTIDSAQALSRIEFSLVPSSCKEKCKEQLQIFINYLSKFQSFNFPDPSESEIKLKSFLKTFIQELSQIVSLENKTFKIIFRHFGNTLELNFDLVTSDTELKSLHSEFLQYSNKPAPPDATLALLITHYDATPKYEIKVSPTSTTGHTVSISFIIASSQFY